MHLESTFITNSLLKLKYKVNESAMKTLNALLLLILTTVTLNASEEIKYFENLGYTIAIPNPTSNGSNNHWSR